MRESAIGFDSGAPPASSAHTSFETPMKNTRKTFVLYVFLFAALLAPAACDDGEDDVVGAQEVMERIDEAHREVAQLQIQDLSAQVLMYLTTRGELPEELSELVEAGKIDEIPLDPWGNEYVYEITGPRDYEIFSKGPDGDARIE